ncbi:MAG: 16S rRNA (cytidine(1402)-2'-O)-methyltransferase, partial [Chlamydiae bacterium]|nr:16S rRNA (cytidine(1402)-2'-O)-methyltransferase [Chlamydiota bacterium]
MPPYFNPRTNLLYIIPTPIGNLKDITYRAIEVLSSCDYILCEDTRHSIKLLNHYNIKKHLQSYHQFNESSKLTKIIEDLRDGKNIALISDGGTPGICDPGATLIKACKEQTIPMTSLPGPCAVTTAFSLFGSNEPYFQFLGFFPRKEKETHLFLIKILHYDGVSIFYESPQRIVDTLTILKKFAPERELLVVREISKSFEEMISGNAQTMLDHFSKQDPKGEFVVLVEKMKDNFFETMDIR